VQERYYEALRTNCQAFILQTRQFISQLFSLALRGLGCEEVRLWGMYVHTSRGFLKKWEIYKAIYLSNWAQAF
jgi:hypothetical protein